MSDHHSPSLSELAKALAACQLAMRPAVKDAANPFFKSKYADLESVWEAARGPLGLNGLSVLQLVTQSGEKEFLTTYLLHTSGEWMKSEMRLDPKEKTPQAVGSCISYARRYTLAALIGVVQSDDDGHAATYVRERDPPPEVEMRERKVAQTNQGGWYKNPDANITPDQVKRLIAIGAKHGWTIPQLGEFASKRGFYTLDHIKMSGYDALVADVEKNPKKTTHPDAKPLPKAQPIDVQKEIKAAKAIFQAQGTPRESAPPPSDEDHLPF